MDNTENSELTPHFKINQPSQKKRENTIHVWNDFVSNFTLHGFHFVGEKRPTLQRLVWLFLLLLMFGLFTWQTSTLVSEYFAYKVSSRIQLISEKKSVFPAVTICNFNRYRKSALNGSKFEKILKLKNPLHKSNSQTVNWTANSEVNKLNMETLVRSTGHQLKYNQQTNGGMLYRCLWKGQPCGALNFTSTLTDMGVCYTFNSGKKGEILKVDGSGSNFGLKLTMSVEQEDYFGYDSFSAGLRIRIHDQGEPPLVRNLGIAVMPGSHVFAGILRQRMISLKYPYETMCQNQKLFNISSYTIAACQDTCKEHFVTKECKCRAYYMRDRRFPLCNVEEYYECVIPKEEEFDGHSLADCNCAEPCNAIKYSAFLSYGLFPSIASAKLYANNSDETVDKHRRNILAIDIFYEDLYYKIMEQVPKYELQNLLGEIGGLLGLFLGASTLTLVEVVDVTISTILVRLLGFKERRSFSS